MSAPTQILADAGAESQPGVSPPRPATEPGLFAEFSSPTLDAWIALAREELGGQSPDEKFGHRTLDGVPVRPIHTRSDLAGLPHLRATAALPTTPLSSDPAAVPNQPWQVRAELRDALPFVAATQLRKDLAFGATDVAILVDQASRVGLDPEDPRSRGRVGVEGVSLTTHDDLGAILPAIAESGARLSVEAGASPLPVAALLFGAARAGGIDSSRLRGEIAADPLAVLARSGTLPTSVSHALDELAELAHWTHGHAPGFTIATAHSAPYHEAGAQVPDELALTLATATEYLRALIDRGFAPVEAVGRIALSFQVGTRIFLEIAKLRAARLLWSQICHAFDSPIPAGEPQVHVRTSRWTTTRFDPWTNLIRNTVEAFAGVVGGATSITVATFDEAVRPGDAQARRIALNTHALLDLESHLGKVEDPGKGSYFLESLTDGVARSAWSAFQQIEGEGGLARALSSGAVGRRVAASGARRRRAVARRSEPFVGVTRFPNLTEKSLEAPVCQLKSTREARIDEVRRFRTTIRPERLLAALGRIGAARAPGARLEAVIEAAAAGATLGELTSALRGGSSPGPAVPAVPVATGAEPFESLRRATLRKSARSGGTPRVLAAALHAGKRASQQLGFAREVLEIAGFDVITQVLPFSAAAVQAAARDSGAVALALAPGDGTDPAILVALIDALVAGDPKLPVILVGKIATTADTRERLERVSTVFAGADLAVPLAELSRALGILP